MIQKIKYKIPRKTHAISAEAGFIKKKGNKIIIRPERCNIKFCDFI
jgi:hypothetical protein